MPCNHEFMAQHACDYIDGTLPASLRARCDAALAACPHCREIHTRALEFHDLSARWQDRPVPHWDRTRFALQAPRRQLPWVSWAALASSCLAIMLVILQLELSTDDGLHISFAGSRAEARMQAVLTRELTAYQEAQQVELENRLSEFARTQVSLNQALLSGWMDRSREERREDLGFILSAWQSQRNQDQRQLDEQLDYLLTTQIESNQYLNELSKTLQPSQRGNL